ncbi:hypothetical protein DNTS_031197 [Danionella cerebrum]|uniref:HIG1 domain-containing protein n=1 Tax=Danionella cerebrum TaxID=2873325 RepID=A0A553MNA5_9TELE|nr:hypothetical protein DNTS_031197 [Danionella translucida]
MVTATTPAVPDQLSKAVTPPVVIDLYQPPAIEGFVPFPVPAKEEGYKEKLIRRTMENPFVPIGCLATVSALGFGLRAFLQGQTQQSQRMMRARIFAQGFTVVAILTGVFASALRSKN